MTTTTLVVMGVSGSGKTTVARGLAERLGWSFAEGDDFHSPSNVAKMTAGRPLDDEDRWPWLAAIADWIGDRERRGESAVVTCSALKRHYRDVLAAGHPSARFVHVTAAPTTIAARLQGRVGHYMPLSLLPSQLEALEPLAADEPGVTISSEVDPGDVVQALLDRLSPLV